MGYPKKPVVLVVDDTIANIRILDDLLRGEYTVRVATNGATALRLALSEPRPDIVLLDIMMPDMDGYEVCRRLKSDPLTSNIAVVFITAMGNEEHEAKGLDLGAVDFIAKPFQPRLVRARVSNHVALKKYNDELNSLVKERTKELYLSRSVTVECLASVVETRDNETGAHVRRTQHGVEILAKRLRLMRPDIWDDDDDTIELFRVCALRHIPIFTFINKMDREARDPFELMENIEEILGIKTYPMNWPIGCGKEFKGVFDRNTRKVLAFSSDGRANGVKKVSETEAELGDPALDELLTPYLHQQLVDEIELLDGAAEEFDLDKVLRGELSPVFFGSALTNFGVEPFLENFLRLTPTPLARVDSLTGEPVDPCRDEFSAFIFKIQANMNKAHRDRIAFMRICSGKFERGMEAYHVQEGKNIKLATGTQLMAQDRAIVDEAYAGDIIGLFDPGIFSIGDTLCTGKKKVEFAGIPTFSPEHFARIEQKDTMKRKQFVKGMEQIAQEGAIQIFREVGGGMEEVVVGVVGVLQLEVLEYRLNTEYNVEIRMQQLPFEQLRWVKNDPDTYNLRDLDLTSDTKAVEDMKGNRLLLFTSDWAVRWAETHNDTLELSEFGNI